MSDREWKSAVLASLRMQAEWIKAARACGYSITSPVLEREYATARQECFDMAVNRLLGSERE